MRLDTGSCWWCPPPTAPGCSPHGCPWTSAAPPCGPLRAQLLGGRRVGLTGGPGAHAGEDSEFPLVWGSWAAGEEGTNPNPISPVGGGSPRGSCSRGSLMSSAQLRGRGLPQVSSDSLGFQRGLLSRKLRSVPLAQQRTSVCPQGQACVAEPRGRRSCGKSSSVCPACVAKPCAGPGLRSVSRRHYVGVFSAMEYVFLFQFVYAAYRPMATAAGELICKR